MYQPRRAVAPVATTVPDQSSSAPRFGRGSWSRLADSVRARGPWLRRGLVAVSVVTVGALVAAATLPQDAEKVGSAPVAKAFAAEAVASVPAASPTPEIDETIIDLRPMYAATWLTVRASADTTSEVLGTITFAAKVWASDEVDGYRQIQSESDDVAGWVPAKSVVDKLPDAPADVTLTACSRGTRVESKLRLDTIKIYRSVCPLFPDVNSFGGWRSGGLPFHKNGRALDIMLTPSKESALGWQIANYLVSHASYFHVDHIIFEQKIWTPSRPYWRHMADRGGTTANHYDHVHVAVRA